ncbi:TM2 domain-containing protein [Streptomyces europaeiscabiei]|uniref:TM2 domain-containing protein n=1 Tax=Streptomyces europaeiscabiei TaxID=146819 RepID=A0ABU4NGV1_9ACTN|nr:TM2 domain-containing protein [Streptomyces europaeiscabiei]MDX2525712.1 TM2 domain-containing protein [Streptomyces europaeiscabiei]MDX2764370.1 TM2 domain-containing protein [Streptomyces europaeiscabiei]MDX2773761.1 TM2 domain-containing protein [Streptomyces europaeiscabiei]MDX3543070.1 TM2 domain-containing protein [Streptomyces europaeiscabiei]MDX3552886.1 TM2 domain-containing protein [Streptomyces europaeiscabiei]
MTEQPQQPAQPPQPPQPGYGYPNAAPGQPGANPYGAPQAGDPYGAPQGGYQQPGAGQPGYGYPQQGGYPQGGGYQVPPAPGGAYTGDPNAPYGYDPYGRPYSDKSKIVAGILSLFLGSFGVGRFYIGHVGLGLAQLFTCGGFGIWALVDGIILLTGSNTTDSNGRVLRG